MGSITYNPPVVSQGSTLTVDETPKTSNFTATNDTIYLIDSSGGSFTVFSPVTPVVDSCFVVFDLGNSGSNPTTVNFTSQGHNLAGQANDFLIDVDNAYTKFRYINASIGYILEK